MSGAGAGSGTFAAVMLARRPPSVSQRRPAWTTFGVALAVRVAGVVAVSLSASGAVFPDEARFRRFADAVGSGTVDQLRPVQQDIVDGAIGFLAPLGAVYAVTGPSLVVGRLFAAVAGAAAAAGIAALANRAWGWRAGLVAGGLVALLPSQVVWSVLLLKDSFVWLGLAVLALALVDVERRPSVGNLAVVAAAPLLLLTVRGHVGVLAGIAAIVTLVVVLPLGSRIRLALGALVLVVAVGAALAMGSGALVEDREIAEARADKATGCAAFDDTAGGGVVDELARLPGALAEVGLAPFPVPLHPCTGLRVASLEAVLWYPLVLLAVVGAGRAIGAHRAMLFPALFAGGLLVVLAVAEGNLGTALRHRAALQWAVVVLATPRLLLAGSWLAARRSAGDRDGAPEGQGERRS